MKPGKETSEFKLTVVMNVVMAALMLMVSYGLITADEQRLWAQLLEALILLVSPMVAAYLNRVYIQARTDLKKHNGEE